MLANILCCLTFYAGFGRGGVGWGCFTWLHERPPLQSNSPSLCQNSIILYYIRSFYSIFGHIMLYSVILYYIRLYYIRSYFIIFDHITLYTIAYTVIESIETFCRSLSQRPSTLFYSRMHCSWSLLHHNSDSRMHSMILVNRLTC